MATGEVHETLPVQEDWSWVDQAARDVQEEEDRRLAMQLSEADR